MMHFNPITLRTAKTLWSFGRFECNRLKIDIVVMEKCRITFKVNGHTFRENIHAVFIFSSLSIVINFLKIGFSPLGADYSFKSRPHFELNCNK